uniref:P-loop NTPase fold protein n=1 Tax=Pseudomonas aeruginosa TaxID=287 RepID=UPI003CF90E67
ISPMVIDGSWGTGKTVLCRKTIKLINDEINETLICAYIDAFEADHTNDPLIPIVAAISELIEDSSKKIAFLNKAKAIFRYGLKASARASVAWLLRSNTETLDQEFQKELEKAVDEGSQNL